MARSYRRVQEAEERLLRAKGILDGVDSAESTSAWFACGVLSVLVEDALACLATGDSQADPEAYAAGLRMIQGYVQDELPLED